MFDKEKYINKLKYFSTWAWQKKQRPYTLIVLTFTLVVLIVMSKPSGVALDLPETSYAIETITAQPEPLASTLYLFGTIESPSRSKIVSAVTTDVLKTPVREGDVIKVGEPLISLDPLEPSLIVKQRQADVTEIEGLIAAETNRHAANEKALTYEKTLLEIFERALDREERLVAQQLRSPADRDIAQQAVEQQALVVNSRELEIADHPARLAQLQARLEKAEALYDLAAFDLARTEIHSPFNGRVAQIYVAPWDRVTPGSPLIDIYNSGTLEVRAQIPSKYLPQMYANLDADETIEADAVVDGLTIELQLVRLASEVQTGRGGVDGFFKITQGAQNLSLGRPVDLLLSLKNTTPVIAIPHSALYSYDRVFKVVDDRLQGVSIERFGDRINEQGDSELLVISDEIAAGDVIMSSLLPNAMTGVLVHNVDN
jgi:multidrug efflux pump subunit AcrA (membrane-fusion protein)